MSFLLAGAAVLAAVWALVHALVGGRECERPLAAEEDLSEVVRETMLLCWHMLTGFLGVMALFLGLGAMGRSDLALAGLVMALSAAVIGVVFPPLRGKSYKLLPQGWLFVPVVALAAWGLWYG